MKLTTLLLLSICFGVGNSCSSSKNIDPKVEGAESEYPSPFCFCPNNDIRFNSDTEQDVLILLYNKDGEQLDTLYAGRFTLGENKISPDFSHLNSGPYFYKFIGEDTTYSKMFTLIQ